MLGHSHATSGAFAWSAAAATLPLTVMTFPEMLDTDARLGPADVLLGVFLTAGAALLPDADHPKGTISRVLGPLTHYACKLISMLSGGHRQGTHSLLFVLVAGVVTWAGMLYVGRWFTLALVFFLLALAVKALHLCPPGDSIRSWGTVAALATAGTFAMDHWISDKPAWLPFCVALGSLTHILGDCLTDRGCPLLWPITWRTSVPIIERTGNKVETWVIAPLFGLGTMTLLWYVFNANP
ncbi:metal-dependent hydrolase [Nocardia higoensis]|uniref:Metal-dependent hydrolase n=1 Tax=Nocardia higoensis TaxID=228599 RepID=A0ABS0DB43_9NOCA|nr:metal-dependent hydrolase [Nocardia higoensis]MBF6353923.1 metal-dependent hydrolase [Nocardia higoensis]